MKYTKKGILQALFLAFLIVGTIFVVKRRMSEKLDERELQPGTELKENGYLMNQGMVFGTVYHITYQNVQDLKKEIEECMASVDESLSMFNQNSTVSRINQNQSQKTDELFREVFLLAKQVNQQTQGCFDPTVASLVNAWGFGFKNGELPDSLQVDSLKSLVGLERVCLNEDNLIIKEDSAIIMDFSAIAKGFAVDQVAKTLSKKGVKNYMVEIGGEVIVKGLNPKGKPWRVGIAVPEEADKKQTASQQGHAYQEVLELEDKAMATSGNYRNFYVTEDGRKLAHTIDPHSGYPVQHSILSSTVFAPTCAEADAYATAFMVMGLEKAKKVLAEQKQLEVYFIYADEKGEYKVYQTPK